MSGEWRLAVEEGKRGSRGEKHLCTRSACASISPALLDPKQTQRSIHLSIPPPVHPCSITQASHGAARTPGPLASSPPGTHPQ
eukprot:123418-Chlamydomonas_euryale.AAC.1